MPAGEIPFEGEPRLLVALVALLVDEREARVEGERSAAKTEVILSAAGLEVREIAALLDKKPDAVRKTLQRAKG